MFSERLKTARKKSGMTQAEVAKKLFISQAAYSKYETGVSSPNPETLARIAEILDVTMAYLLGKTKDGVSSGRIRVPVLGRVAAGIPIEAIEEIIDYEDLNADEYATGEYFGLKIRGDSMEPRIRDGDVVIVRRQDDVDSGDVAIVLVNGDEGTCKRVKKSPQGVTLLSSNPAYEPMYFNNEEIERLPVKVIGRVVELRAKF